MFLPGLTDLGDIPGKPTIICGDQGGTEYSDPGLYEIWADIDQIIPLNAKNANDSTPAVTRPMDVSWSGFGTLANRIRSRTPANRIRARPNPTA